MCELGWRKRKPDLCFHRPRKKGSSSRCEWRSQVTIAPGVPATLSPAEITVTECMTVPEKTLKHHSHSSLQSDGGGQARCGLLVRGLPEGHMECGIPAFGSHIPPGVLAESLVFTVLL